MAIVELNQASSAAPGRHAAVPLGETAVLLQVARAVGEHVDLLLAVENTVPLAELVHESLVSQAIRGSFENCPELTGHDDDGNPLRMGHRHAHVLPLDLDRDGWIDFLLIWVPLGIRDTVMAAIESLTTLVAGGGIAVVHLRPVGPDHCPALSRFPRVAMPGQLSQMSQMSQETQLFQETRETLLPVSAPQPVPIHRASGGPLLPDGGVLAPAVAGRDGRHRPECVIEPVETWISLTPFVAPRFVKRRGNNALENQVQAELASRRMPPAESIEIVAELQSFFEGFGLCRRPDKPQPPERRGHVIRLKFGQPVCGPIALGYASHFGLGMFQADEPSS